MCKKKRQAASSGFIRLKWDFYKACTNSRSLPEKHVIRYRCWLLVEQDFIFSGNYQSQLLFLFFLKTFFQSKEQLMIIYDISNA